MVRMRAALFLLLLLPLSGCGILVGYAMTAGTGVDDLRVVSGSLADVKPGKAVAIVAPFRREGTGYYLSRGDDAVWFADAFNDRGLLKADVRFIEAYGKLDLEEKALRETTAEKLGREMGLSSPPDYLLFGVILHRDSVVAPMQGVIMEVGYRLEFLDLATRRSTVVEVEAHDLFPEVVPGIAGALSKGMGKK